LAGEHRLPAQPLSPESNPTLAGQLVAFAGKFLAISPADARALVESLGGRVIAGSSRQATLFVVGAAGSERARAAAERRAARLNRSEAGRARVISEDDLCRLAGRVPPSELRRRYYGSRDILAMYPALREDHLRRLQRWQVVQPVLQTHGDTFFAFPDLSVFRQTSAEIERGTPLPAIRRALRAWRRGQLAFDWIDGRPATVVRLPVNPAPPLMALQAESYFQVALALDDGNPETREAAARGYQRALEADPNLVPALVNLANLHYADDELAEAQALYERALALEPDLFEAHFNLGNVHHDAGRLAEAERAYREALRCNPDYADAHFYLAVTLEKLGRSRDAKPHWKAYLRLDPDGEHHDIARHFED
jgi:tetratricopeptide (TPR) repeat protein